MKRLLLPLTLLSLTACVDPMTLVPGKFSQMEPAQNAVVYRQEAPDQCYLRAYRVLANRPAQITASNATVRHISGLEKGVITYSVQVSPNTDGCMIEVQAGLLPNKLVSGTLYEPQEYIKQLQQ
jgi:hypothetical protein